MRAQWWWVGAVVVAASMGACSKGGSKGEKAGAGSGTGTGTGTGSMSTSGKAIVAGGCLSCHSEQMLAQQRLTPAQWQKTVTKMVGWGANVEPTEVAPLVGYLSATYGPDAGTYVPETLTAEEALAELASLPDDGVPAGDPEHGKALFVENCAGCHGPDARGGIGVLLVDRPILYRAADVAKMVHRGRGKMRPMELSDAAIGDVLAYLRTLRSPPPP